MGSNAVGAGQARCLPCEQAYHLQEMHMVSWESYATHTGHNGLSLWGACLCAYVCVCVWVGVGVGIPMQVRNNRMCLKTMHTIVKIHF